MSIAGSAAYAESKAIFAGGCFWCMQPVFDAADGVTKTRVGYTGGTTRNPTYDDVSRHNTGHVEAIEVTYDEKKIPYPTLVSLYFENIDPFDAEGQFADKGESYHTVVFVADAHQRRDAEEVIADIQKKFPTTPVATKIKDAAPFYEAETYHQDYYKKNSLRYNLYKHGSGRVQRLKEIWNHE
jgi:methionine-S-sulfoxide reductase